MREIKASRTFEWSEKAQNGLRWLQKFFFSGTIYLGTCTILMKC